MAHARAERAQAVSGGSKMAEAPVFGLLLRMSLPLMLSMMIQALYNIVDSVFIGMLPERAEALQALGYAYPIQRLLVAGGVRVPIMDDFPRGALYDLFNTKPDEIAELKRKAVFEANRRAGSGSRETDGEEDPER